MKMCNMTQEAVLPLRKNKQKLHAEFYAQHVNTENKLFLTFLVLFCERFTGWKTQGFSNEHQPLVASSSQSFIWNYRLETQQLAFEISKRKFDSKQHERKVLGLTGQKRWPWCVRKVLVLGASSLSRVLECWQSLHNGKRDLQILPEEKNKKESKYSCLSFAMFYSVCCSWAQ